MIQAEQPRLLLVAGPNGAGKTTVTERGLAHEWFAGCEYVNPDFIARDEFGDWNSESAVLQAARRKKSTLSRAEMTLSKAKLRRSATQRSRRSLARLALHV